MAFDNNDFVKLLNFYKEDNNFPDNVRNLLIKLVKYLNQMIYLKIH